MHAYHLGEVIYRAHSGHVIIILSGVKIRKLTNQNFGSQNLELANQN